MKRKFLLEGEVEKRQRDRERKEREEKKQLKKMQSKRFAKFKSGTLIRSILLINEKLYSKNHDTFQLYSVFHSLLQKYFLLPYIIVLTYINTAIG